MTLTPEQFNYLVNKDDLKKFEEKMDKKFNDVLNAIDSVIKSLKAV